MKHLILFSANNFLLLCALNRAKNDDIVKLDLNVLYIRYLSLVAMESDHSCLYSVISLCFFGVFFKNSLRNVSSYTITSGVRLLTFKNRFSTKKCILSTTFKSASKPQTLAQ